MQIIIETNKGYANGIRNSVQVQGSNVRHYYTYLQVRAKAYRDSRIDWVREGQGRLKIQSVDKGLLRETEIVQDQVAALLKCDVGSNRLPFLVLMLRSSS